jgi:predicted  nucleic acid-binding Zn-ribbon protein
MNAAMRQHESEEGADMPANDDLNLGIQVAKLQSDVTHIQSDVTDIKANLRITNQRIESLEEKTEERFEKVDQKFNKVWQKLDELKDSLASAKIWALLLYFGLAGSLFYALARGFRWI